MTLIVEAIGKRELARFGIAVPMGSAASSPEEAGEIARAILETGTAARTRLDYNESSHKQNQSVRLENDTDNAPAVRKIVVKAQVRTTGRAGKGLVKFCDSPESASAAAAEMLAENVAGFPVEQVLIEEFVEIEREFFAAIITDTAAGKPLAIFASRGGSGIEEIASEYPGSIAKKHIGITDGLRPFEARGLAKSAGLSGAEMTKAGEFLEKLYAAYRALDARSLEVNPVALTADGRLIAADCHLVVDDYAALRQPQLGIEIARELGHPPTALERAAYACEKGDYRGTFYFIQLETGFSKGQSYLGFHGSGGGGSMMSMDALAGLGFKPANFCDTSGNPPASKVYRAAKIILSQPGIDGYFLSGSGVASQEQYHGARGLIKAFRETPLAIPAVIRLGGNKEELAIEYLNRFCADLPVPVEAYGKDDKVTFCAERMKALIDNFSPPSAAALASVTPLHNEDIPEKPYEFKTLTGRITFDHSKCALCESKACIDACKPGILSLENGAPALNISAADAAKGKCTECLACEAECFYTGKRAVKIDLPVPGF